MPEGQSTDRNPVTMTTASLSCLTPKLHWLRAVGGGGSEERERDREKRAGSSVKLNKEQKDNRQCVLGGGGDNRGK